MSTVGFLDSGVGGLSVWRETAALLPGISTVYLADTAHCPYGSRSASEVLGLVLVGVRFLLALGCAPVVLACNTATAAAVDTLRATYPETPFVGMEPAVKPAAERSPTGTIGILATPTTFHGRLFRDTSARYASGLRRVAEPAGDLVPFVERGDLSSPVLRAAVAAHLSPMLAADADPIVLGCTHFPFLLPVLKELAPGRTFLDPAPAVARRVASLLPPEESIRPDAPARSVSHAFYVTRHDSPAPVLRHTLAAAPSGDFLSHASLLSFYRDVLSS